MMLLELLIHYDVKRMTAMPQTHLRDQHTLSLSIRILCLNSFFVHTDSENREDILPSPMMRQFHRE